MLLTTAIGITSKILCSGLNVRIVRYYSGVKLLEEKYSHLKMLANSSASAGYAIVALSAIQTISVYLGVLSTVYLYNFLASFN